MQIEKWKYCDRLLVGLNVTSPIVGGLDKISVVWAVYWVELPLNFRGRKDVSSDLLIIHSFAKEEAEAWKY